MGETKLSSSHLTYPYLTYPILTWVSAGETPGFGPGTGWFPIGSHLVFAWLPDGCHMVVTWLPGWQPNVVKLREILNFHVGADAYIGPKGWIFGGHFRFNKAFPPVDFGAMWASPPTGRWCRLLTK